MQFNQLKTSKVFTGQLIKINQIAANTKSNQSLKNRNTSATTKNSARMINIKSKNIKTNKSKIRLKTKQI